MTAKTTRILKEARPLLWPWCAVALAGVLPLLQPLHGIAEPIHFIGFLVGLPLLATLSFGNEFQHRTLSLLLTQPVDRMQIWGEKLSVTAVAVLSAALVFFLGWRAELQLAPGLWLFAGACTLASIASAPFWTLVARSTLGGITLGYAVPYFLFVVWAGLTDWESFRPPAIASFVFLGYAGVMLWLGRRKLARFQVTGGVAGDDLLMAGAGLVPAAWAGWFRCRPTGAVLNLVRKELRLLRPLWLLTLLALLGWICVTLLGPVPAPEGGPAKPLQVAVVLLGTLSWLIAILAGSLSLGEERTSGTHSWHLTLPVSARRQWLLKLFLALVAAPVCAVLLPVLVVSTGRFLLGSPFLFVDPQVVVLWLLAASLLSFAAFWCACTVNGTVRAVLWLLPLLGALGLAGRFGGWVAGELTDLVVSRFDLFLFADFGFTNAVSNIQLYSLPDTQPLVVTLLLVPMAPLLLFALFQSYRLFRKQLQDSPRLVIRSLLPLALLAFLCSFSLGAYYLFVSHARQQMWAMFRETHEAIEKVRPGAADLDAAHPLQLTVEDLAKVSPLSERTRRWLANSRITVAPYKPQPGGYCCGANSRGISFAADKAQSWYIATIHRPGGSNCTVSFKAGRGYGILGGVCE